MSFISPLFLIGALAAAVPVIIHLIGRQRAPRRPFAALDFVLRCNRQVAQRLRLRQLLLLAVRMLLVGGVAVMLAKPFTEAESDLPALGGRAQSAVIVIDDTLSMRRLHNGQTLLASAQARAQQLVTLLGASADVAVLRLAGHVQPLPTLTRDTRRVRAAITSLQPTYRHATVGPSLQLAARILSDSSLPERHIFVLTDLAGHTWSPEVADSVRGVSLHLMDMAKDVDSDNRAVVDVAAAPSAAPGARSTRIVARVCNYAGKAETLRVGLSINDKQVARGLLPLGANACGNKVFDHTFSRGGMHRATVSLESDALHDDDQRFLMVEVESPVRVLLVNGEPSPVRHRDELFYLEAALQQLGSQGQPVAARAITPADLGQVRFDPFDVVVLCNVASVPDSRRADLEAFVQRGGGLLVALGENADAAALNATLGNLLPQELRIPISSGSGTGDSTLRIGRVDSEHPIFAAIWSEGRGGGLRSARFQRVYRLSPATRVDRKVILWYDDGSPALVESRRGEGRILLFTSTLDRDWNDLPIRPGYLPLVQQMIRYLSRAPSQAPRRSVEVGGSETVPLARGVKQVRLLGPQGIERQWSRAQLADKESIEVPADLPGFYYLSGGGSVLRPLERESFVANVDPKESDLRKVTAAVAGKAAAVAAVRAKQRIELWHGVGIALLLLLLGESFIIRRG
jgi:hypothetical protein